jgi:ATP-dependent exoDNAse (exonuclease V) beta subunit
MTPSPNGTTSSASYFERLSPEQRRAVQRTGQDVCVVAGPGSGKTRVLTERFAWLVEQGRIDAARILAITFTDKAAIEIKQRLINRFAEQPELRERIERAWVSTIHGFCARLLRDNAIIAGLSPEFTILEQAPADHLQREAAEEALDGLLHEQPHEFRRLLEALDLSTQDNGRQPDLCASLLEIYETMRVSGVDSIKHATPAKDVSDVAAELVQEILRDPNPGKTDLQRIAVAKLRELARSLLALPSEVSFEHFETVSKIVKINLAHLVKDSLTRNAATKLKNEVLPQLEAFWLSSWYGDLHDLLRESLQRIDTTYRARKRQRAAVDFSDLEELTIRLLESNDTLRRETVARFDQVLMDELQDTNRAQWRLIKLVCGDAENGKLFAVGDINQSIYGFRHADPEVFAEYRGQLRDKGHEIDELADNYRSRPEILQSVASMLDDQPGIEPRILQSRGEFSETDGPLVELLIGQETAGENSALAQDVEASLVAERIHQWVAANQYQYRDIAVLARTYGAMKSFEEAFDRFNIPYLVSGGRGFMEARETRDVLALLAALVNPLDEIPLFGLLRGPFVNLSDEDLYRMGREGWRLEFENRFGEIRELAGFIAPDRLIAIALDCCGYNAQLKDRERANVEKLLGWIRREHYNRPRPLAELLEDLEALRESESVAEAPPPEAGDVVRMMTIHAAKGLEFPVVFVVALHRGADRQKPILLFSKEHGMGAKWRHPVTGKGASDYVHALLSDRDKQREAAEENRLFYVALTRAMHRLVLSFAERKQASIRSKLAIATLAPSITTRELSAPPSAKQTAVKSNSTVIELAQPAFTGQHDASAPVTSVAMFSACPRRYYLDRYLGFSANRSHDTAHDSTNVVRAKGGAKELGLSVHTILSRETQEGAEIFPIEATRLADNFYKSDLGQRATSAVRIEREFDFLLDIEDIILRGQIDLWFEDTAGQLVVVDYKTDRDESQASAYALQLQLYALALKTYAGKFPEEAVLFYLRSGNQVSIDLRPEALGQAATQVAAFREAQETIEYPVRPGDQCRKCSYWGGLCPIGRDLMVGD